MQAVYCILNTCEVDSVGGPVGNAKLPYALPHGFRVPEVAETNTVQSDTDLGSRTNITECVKPVPEGIRPFGGHVLQQYLLYGSHPCPRSLYATPRQVLFRVLRRTSPVSFRQTARERNALPPCCVFRQCTSSFGHTLVSPEPPPRLACRYRTLGVARSHRGSEVLPPQPDNSANSLLTLSGSIRPPGRSKISTA